jgi:hypothetical protein
MVYFRDVVTSCSYTSVLSRRRSPRVRFLVYCDYLFNFFLLPTAICWCGLRNASEDSEA